MRSLVVACALAAGPAFAGGLVVQKKVTSLATKDKVTKLDVLTKLPDVLSCFDAARTVTVTLAMKDGVFVKAKSNADDKTDSCLRKKLARMSVAGTFTATIDFIVKPDPRKK